MSARRQQGSDGAKPVSTSRSLAALCASRGSGSLFLPLPVLHVLSQTGLKGAVSPTRVWVVVLTSLRAQVSPGLKVPCPRHVGLGRGSHLSTCSGQPGLKGAVSPTRVWVVVLTSLRAQVSPGLKVPCPRHVGLGRGFHLSTCSGQPGLKGAVSPTRGSGSWFSPLYVLRSARA